MAGLERLRPLIYHEKQQEGSMLCAQHALNSLLQGNYFAVTDLSDIAGNLDTLEREQRYDDDNSRAPRSMNMDDTGFFSVQVLDSALRVWGLNLRNWRAEEMRPYHDRPYVHLAFILNLDHHWFTLRRFGHPTSNIDLDPGEGHWFNLNSFSPQPEWVSKLYLAMVLQQAESDGYSVFVVTQADSDGALALPRTEADDLAATLPEPTSAGQSGFQLSSYTLSSVQHASEAALLGEPFEDEDYELQIALQASLAQGGSHDYASVDSQSLPESPPVLGQSRIENLPTPSTSRSNPTLTPSTPPPIPYLPPPAPPVPPPPFLPGHADLDPVSASLERNRVMLQRMREMQEMAQQELWAEDPVRGERLRERARQEAEEEEALRRAIEESEAMARQNHPQTLPVNSRNNQEDEDEDEDEEMVSDDDVGGGPLLPPHHPFFSGGFADHRVYDDDDAELQAALKASLEQVPNGWEPPPPPPVPSHPQIPVTISSGSSNTPIPVANTHSKQWTDDSESVMSEDTTNSQMSPVEEAPTLEEIRKRRLAKFGLPG
ncbi:Josephin-domain-containing protein [Pluteus cervinus]|uniref:Josephin-domain-containing protein n=1 Tax=Pluteus cervinus TaxID=181527 RepID=A0ACD3BBH9_9AGAR|nr:Josephin-domain-containing protein [Pluteus cervinus]